MVQYGVGLEPRCVVAADFDHQLGADPLAGASYPSLGLLRNSGAGGFLPMQGFDVGYAVTGLAVADFDGDGSLDVAALRTSPPGIALLLGDGVGGFERVDYDLGIGQGGTALKAVDVNADGRPDLLVLAPAFLSTSMVVMLNQGSGIASVEPRGSAPIALSLDWVRRQGDDIVFSVTLPSRGPVRLGIFDVTGRRLWELRTEGGRGRSEFRARAPLPSGVYFAVVTQGERRVTRKSVLVR